MMRGAMSLLTMVTAVLPDAAAEQLEVILQVLATYTFHKTQTHAIFDARETSSCPCQAHKSLI